MSNILVVLETREGSLRPACLEAVGAARTLADARGSKVIALAPESCDIDAAQLGGAGADLVLTSDAANHSADGAAATAARVAGEQGCDVVLLSATVRGRDLTPRVAALLDSGFAADCVEMDSDTLTFTRPVYAGKALSRVSAANGPLILGIRPNVFSAEECNPGAEAPVSVEPLEFSLDNIRAMVKEITAPDNAALDVAEADIVVAGGRGVGGPEGFAPLEELAAALGAAVGASRAAVDAGWRDHAAQVGQTGKVVAPQLYFAAGISGAIQHLAGMRTSKCIVAINKEAEAPIFKVANYGIVGDLFEIVPALTEAFKKAL